MRLPMRSKLLRFAVVVALVVGACWWLDTRLLQPRIQMATLEQIKAVLPKDLLVERREDPAAEARFGKLETLMKSLDGTQSIELWESFVQMKRVASPHGPSRLVPSFTEKEKYARAQRVWASHPALCGKLTAVLAEGPVQSPWRQVGLPSPDYFSGDLSNTIGESAGLYSEFGDFQRCTELLVVGMRVNDALVAARASLSQALLVNTDEAILTKAVREASFNPRFPVGCCRALLAAIHSAPETDAIGAQTFANEFREVTLKILTTDPGSAPMWYYPGTYDDNPIVEMANGPNEARSPSSPVRTVFIRKPLAGTYDALETARQLGNAVAAAMTNCERPLSQYDGSADEILARGVRQLPERVPPQTPAGLTKWWEDLKYRVGMNTTHNSLGRVLFPDNLHFRALVESFCMSRADRDLTRVALAARIYRAAHGGKLPTSAAGFIPILKAWPTDPYNGKPMLYSPENEVVYCVGPDLVDNGGDVGPFPGKGKDVGVSLILRSQ